MATGLPEGPAAPAPPRGNPVQPSSGSWRRIALLILAITIHNIPGEVLPLRAPAACPKAKSLRRSVTPSWLEEERGPS